MRYPTRILLVVWAALCSTGGAASEPVGCPNTIEVNQQLAPSVEGWTTILDDTPHQLATVTFYDGAPKDRASLVYDTTTKAAGKETAIWHFLPQGDRQIWMACSYASTAIVLAKALPAGISMCSVTYDPLQLVAGMPLIERIDCR